MKLLATAVSQRKIGDSCILAKEVLISVEKVNYEIVELAEKKIGFYKLLRDN